MRIVVAGASGFLGSHLTESLTDAGHDVVRLVRRPPGNDHEAEWDPYAGHVDLDLIESATVVVNLAGSPTAGNPHSKRWAEELRRSRVTTTRVLAEAIAATRSPPSFVAGNGISYYGDHGSQVLTEDSDSLGDALLTRVAREWQRATDPAREAGARVCVLRTAPVIDRSSAPLKLMLLPFRLGLGARLGSGRQYFPVISLRDWVGAATFLVESPDVSGPANLCCPQTPTNAEFTEALADAVGRRARLAAPTSVLGRAAGAMAPELFGSANTRPATLVDAGYEFADRDVRDVIASALG
jgi:uncharacterized protein (TIGR01777 family)